jgi:hypothetical protein
MFPRRKKAKREGVGDNSLLRAAFKQELTDNPLLKYDKWLSKKGVDLTTGKMTETGIAYFKTLLDHDRLNKQTKVKNVLT